MKKIFFIGLLIIIGFVLYSCGPAEITVSSRPERPYYMRPSSPGPAYVWIEGDWVARGGRYYWREGHWAHTRRVWVTGAWESRGNGWYLRRGHWQ